ncbi:MAG: hypothetical protein ACREMD_06890 [Gemmatimonadota bacterium]
MQIRPQHGHGVVKDMLRPAVAIPRTDDLELREASLDEYMRRYNPKGYALGDLLQGGRTVTDREAARFGGIRPEGVPTGLERCPRCGEWRGVCLKDHPLFRNLLVPVFCQCDNWNRCALCRHPLAERRLQACYYNDEDDRIWCVPGFTAQAHKCRRNGAANQVGGFSTDRILRFLNALGRDVEIVIKKGGPAARPGRVRVIAE